MSKADLIAVYDRRGRLISKLKIRRILGRKYRQKLLQDAKGNVLEVAVGTGANFGFYPAGIKLVAVDFSPVLLEMAKRAAVENNLAAEFMEADVETLNFAENTFDTIVSTLSLCAYDDPVKVLRDFNRWCKPGGRILLFEHGLSTHRWLNWLFKRFDAWNYRRNGCRLDYDVIKTVEAAGFTVEKVENIMFGAHYLVWGRPSKAKN